MIRVHVDNITQRVEIEGDTESLEVLALAIQKAAKEGVYSLKMTGGGRINIFREA